MFNPEGIYVAMMTPFDQRRRVDEAVLRDMVEFTIGAGVHGLFPCSSSGEFARLTDAERHRVIEIVVEQAKGRVAVTPGVGAPGPDQVISYASEAQALGGDAVVICPPYYYTNIPEESVLEHFRTIAKAVSIPIIIYNIPGYCVPISPEQVATLCAEFRHVVGIKDSSLNMATFNHMLDLTRQVRSDFGVMTGGDEMIYPSLVVGGSGGMLISAGIVPEVSVSLYNTFLAGDNTRALRLQLALLKLMRAMSAVSFPAGFKLGLESRGFPPGADRQPMGPEGEKAREQARGVIKELVEQALAEVSVKIQVPMPTKTF